MNALLFIVALVGLSLLVYSLFEISVYGELYFDRDYYCIERFRKAQKATDLVSVLHNIAKGFFGFVLVYYAIVMLKSLEVNPKWILLTSFSLYCMDAMVSLFVVWKYSLKNQKESIMQQWKTQKRVTADNDHEVNMYRAAVRVTKHPLQIIIMVSALLIISFLF